MVVNFDNMQFSEWRASEKDGRWTDVFIQRISPFVGLPPVEYAIGMYRLASLLIRKRPSASLWVQVDAPGRWYTETLRSVLRWKGKLPIAVTAPSALAKPDLFDYLVLPYLEPKRPLALKRENVKTLPFSKQTLLCLQVLGRIERGDVNEIASLAGLHPLNAQSALEELEKMEMVLCENQQVKKETVSTWRIKHEGLSLVLRSWGIPKEMSFERRKELALSDPGGEHRLISHLWPGWLRAAWPQTQIWAGWSEVSLSGLPQTPDALAWGMMAGQETLFWLEVESGHASRGETCKKIRHRFVQAAAYAKAQNVCLVFALLGRDWVCEAAKPAFENIPPGIAVTIGNWRDIGRLPLTEWGRVEW
jgi:hypothetical protein